MKLVCKLEGEDSTDGRSKSGGILREAVRAVGGGGIGGATVRVAFSNVNGIREFVPEGVKSCQLMGEDTLKSDVHALEGVAQGVVESSKVMLAKENLGYVGLGGSVVLKRNITGEVFQYELKVNPWGDEGWTVYVMIDCRIGGDDRFGPPEMVVKTGERDGRFVLPLEKEYRGDWTVDWVETGEIDSNFFQRFVSGCRPSMVLKCGLEHEVYRAWADAPWIIGYAVGPEVWKDLLGNWDEAMKAVTRGVILRLLS